MKESIVSQEEMKRRLRLVCIGARHLPNSTSCRTIFMHYRKNVLHKTTKIMFQFTLMGMGVATPTLVADGNIGRETWRSLRNLYRLAGVE